MKKIIFSLVAMMIATVSFAQNQVAMLAHGGDNKYFYGSTAFRNALEIAEDGDVISLSGGQFACGEDEITKVLTIRGAGYNGDTPTILYNEMKLNAPETSGRFIVEGVKLLDALIINENTQNACIIKCELNKLCSSSKTASFVNSRIHWITDDSKGNFINSYAYDLEYGENAATFLNCVVRPRPGYGVYNKTFVNCIIIENERNLTESVSATNCISVGISDTFNNILAGSNNVAGLDMSIFVDSDEYNDLTEANKAKYVGTDGTPVGVFGGHYPFSTKLSYPTITKFKVADKTSDDNKLSVEVVVSK